MRLYYFTMTLVINNELKGVKMNKLKMGCFAFLLIGGIASAKPSCEGFQIKLKNNLADDLVVTTIKLDGASIKPAKFEKLGSKSEQVFTVHHISNDEPMVGEFTLHTVSLPVKTVKVEYTLENKMAVCEHTDNSPKSDYELDKTREVGGVQYSIDNQ